MTGIKKIFILAALAIPTAVCGQTKTVAALEKPYIEVTGSAEKEIIPDEIFIAILIKERAAGKEKITVDAQEEKLKSAVKELGIDIDNLSLSDLNADYVRIRWKTKEVQTKKEYVLKVNNATLAGQVFQQLEKLDITDAYVSRVNHSKIDSLRKDARIMAIKAAKTKADYLLKAIGEQAGKPIYISEMPLTALREDINTSVRNIGTTDGLFKQSYDKKDEIQFKKILITYSIIARFEIK